MPVRTTIGITVILAGLVAAATSTPALLARQSPAIDIDFSPALRWRPLGPTTAGRITALDGVADKPGTFYAAAAGGGLWKTTDFGASWQPAFDAAPAGMVSAVAVAPSRSDLIYAAAAPSSTPATAPGDTLHRSTDAGATWQTVGAPAAGTITDIAVDPRIESSLFIAVPASGTPDRQGVFHSIDGGQTFDRVLDVRADDVTIVAHPGRSGTFFVVATADDRGTARLFRSTDDGRTWQPALATVPPPGVDAATWLSLAVAPDSGDAFLLVARASGAAALYRSDDVAQSWSLVNDNVPADATTRPRIAIAPADRLHLAAGGVWESTDGGVTLTAIDGMPRDAGASRIWQHPSLAGVMAVAGPAGSLITVNGGRTWSRDAGPPSADVSRVIADTAFPYRVCATLAPFTACRPHGADDVQAPAWHRLPPWAGVVTPDPLDPDVLVSGAAIRWDRRTQQAVDIAWSPEVSTVAPHAVMVFAPDGRTLYAASRAVWQSTNGGLAWAQASPDFSGGNAAARISALAVSPVDPRALWVGLDNGRVHTTGDAGTTWVEAATPIMGTGTVIRSLEPSRFDSRSAYVIAAADDGDGRRRSRLLRTRDGGATWVDIGSHVSAGGNVHVVREDALRRGLLFAGTDQSVVVSFDDGERWQSLGLNLPPTSVRDLAIRDADLIAATGGHGVWLLDDLSPLRQLTPDVARADVFLFRPTPTWRVRAAGPDDQSLDPAGATHAHFTYLLSDANQDDVTIDVIETATGDVLRRFSNRPDPDRGQIALASGPGLHRVTWDLRYPPPVTRHPGSAPGVRVMPGVYQVRLTAGGRSIRQALSIRMDPRVRASVADLTVQRDLGRALDAARAALEDAMMVASPASDQARTPTPSARALLDELDRLTRVLQQADVRPSARVEAAIEDAIDRVTRLIGSGVQQSMNPLASTGAR